MRVPLWESGQVPLATGDGPGHEPDIEVFRPERPNGLGVVIFPGGGYRMLADHEGPAYARFLNGCGCTAFVVRYRLASDDYHDPVMRIDAQRAIRWVRNWAGEFGIGRIGVMGSSAGGHLAATALTEWRRSADFPQDVIDAQSARPDFGVLCYPVISLVDFMHLETWRNLLGPIFGVDSAAFSPHLHVDDETPPTFLFHTAADDSVPVANSLLFATALSDHGVAFALHIYPQGGHGIGLGPHEDHPWTEELRIWLAELG